ncbi:MAG: ADOP family duplicated permease [Gemmatimonadota bacterium]|nr:ADOP family duplicated permease [Gemmatimonadota bacterium]
MRALRSLTRTPLVTATAIAIIGLGVGATTAAFSVVRGVLVHSVPYPQPDALVQVISTLSAQGITRGLVAFPRFEAYAAESRSFAALAAYVTQDFTVSDDVPLSVPGVRVSPAFFTVTGVPPAAGRAFTAEEHVRGGPPAVMISERLARARFGSAAGAANRTITVNGEAVPIVGVVASPVAPPLQDADLWFPRVYETDVLPPEQVERGAGFLRVMGRLRPGATLDDARADASTISAGYRQRLGSNRDAAFDAAVLPLNEYLFGDVRGTLVFTWMAGVLVFLLACANAGNVLLARYLTRRAELEVRTAVGASPGAIARELLAEAAVIGTAGVALGLAVAAAALGLLRPMAARVLATSTPYAFDWTVLALAAALALVAIAMAAAVPALQATRAARAESLASGARAVGSRAATRWRQGFVMAQVALSFLLLASAFQQAASLLRLERADRGFAARGLTTFRLAPSAAKYPTPESRVELFRQVEERVGAIPGVAGVGASQAFPVGDDQQIPFAKEADQAKPRAEWPVAQFRIVTPGYFGALGVTVLRGRGITAADAKDAPPVTVVNAAFARRHFGDANPVGERIFLGSFPGAREIVGVVSDVPQKWLETGASPEAYIPMPQLPVRMPPSFFMVRTTTVAGAVVPALRTAVAGIDPAQALTRVRTMDDAAAEGLAIPRMRGTLTVGFALLGLVLAAVGLWSVVAQFVADRRREIAIRAALGAPPGAAAAGVIRAVTVMTAGGLAIGVAATVAFGAALRSAVAGLAEPSVLAMAAAAVPLALTALATARMVARRAERVDPVGVLRAE